MCRLNITEDEVKKPKQNYLPTSIKHENNKVKRAMFSGSGTDVIPCLCYYKELKILQEQMEGEPGISTLIENRVNILYNDY